MHIAIPDDYQDLVHTLRCFRTLDGHRITRYREPASDISHMVSLLGDAEIIVPIRERSRYTRALLERLPNLKLISQTGRSTTHVDIDACTDLGIAVCAGTKNSPAAPTELTWALILASRRHIPIEAARMKADQWPSTLAHRLADTTLGVYGLGAIGTPVANIGRAFGMRILVWGREKSLQRARELGFDCASSHADLFEQSDVLTLQIRLTKETRGIVTRADLARMKPTALIVNTARGELIEAGALSKALRAGRPGFAALDVYPNEPVIGRGDPLLELPNALCTHHIAWAEHENFELYFGEAFEQIIKYAAGQPVNLINPEVTSRARRIRIMTRPA